MKYLKRSALVLGMALLVAGCDDDGTPTEPGLTGEAAVEGRVEQTAPEASSPYQTASAPDAQAAQQASAQTVFVGEVMADGTVSTMAEADVQADGSFRIEGVPTGRADLQVVARDGEGSSVGRVMVHGETRADIATVVAPINYETSVEASTWARLHAEGQADATSSQEVALLVHTDASASADILANGGVAATAGAVATSARTMSRVFAQGGADLTASARADILADAAVQFAESRDAGTSVQAAHETYLAAAVDAYAAAGASAEVLTTAMASAASTMDAQIDAQASARGQLVASAVRMNLKARQRLAQEVSGSVGADLAAEIQAILADAEAQVRGTATAAEIRAVIQSHVDASANAMVSGVVSHLAADLSATVRSQVETEANAVAEAARLDTRLSAAASADAAAQVVADYRSDVRAAVDAMIEASGRTDVDAEAMTSLFIAAHGSAHVR